MNPADPLLTTKNLVEMDGPGSDPIQVLLTVSNQDESVPNKKCATALGASNQYRCLSIHDAYQYL